MIIDIEPEPCWMSHEQIRWDLLPKPIVQACSSLDDGGSQTNLTAEDLVIRDLALALVDAEELARENQVLREMRSVVLEQLAHATAHLTVARHSIAALRAQERQTLPASRSVA